MTFCVPEDLEFVLEELLEEEESEEEEEEDDEDDEFELEVPDDEAVFTLLLLQVLSQLLRLVDFTDPSFMVGSGLLVLAVSWLLFWHKLDSIIVLLRTSMFCCLSVSFFWRFISSSIGNVLLISPSLAFISCQFVLISSKARSPSVGYRL